MYRFCLRNSGIKLSGLHLQSQNNILSNLPRRITPIYSSRNFSNKTEKDVTKFEKIYEGPLTPQIRAVKIFSLSSSFAGLVAQPIIIKEATVIGSTGLLIGLCSVVGFFTFVTPLLLHLITKKYVTEVSYDPETSTYMATTINFFLRHKKVLFKADDVVVPEIPGMFTTFYVQGKPLFVEARHFSDPIHYAKMMGYDKPIDFKFGDLDDSDTSEKPTSK